MKKIKINLKIVIVIDKILYKIKLNLIKNSP